MPDRVALATSFGFEPRSGSCWPPATSPPQPAGDGEIAEHERLPPRQRWTKRRRLTARTPQLHRQRDATIVKPADRRLPTLPANADREMPAPGGPAGTTDACRRANEAVWTRSVSDEVFFADPRAKKPWNVVAAWVGMKASELEKPSSARGGSERDAEMDARTNL